MNAEPFVIERPGPGRLAVMPRPAGGRGQMRALRAAGVDTLVCALTPGELDACRLVNPAALAAEAGLSYVAFPIIDFGVPDAAALRTLARGLAEEIEVGRFVVVHCMGGVGRSGTIACAVLIQLGLGAEEAMELVSRARGHRAPETPAQRALLHTLASSCIP